MAEVDRFWRRVPWILVVGNLVGALLTFLYFRVIDLPSAGPSRDLGPWEIGYFVVGFSALVAVGYVWVTKWTRPLVRAQAVVAELPEAEARLVKRRALMLPPMLAMVSFVAWMAAGVIWGVLWPVIAGVFAPERIWRTVFGITVVAGSVSTAFVFLVAEHQWRRAMPHFFPRGDVSGVAGAVRLSVRMRLLVIFLLISIIPLGVLGTIAYARALSLAGADAAAASHLVGELRLIIAFIVGVGIVAAVGLAIFTARSVADPLRRLEREMAAVGRGELDGRVPVVANDEIGAVGEGFNRMLEGLREREVIRETFGKYVTREVRDEILAGRASFDGQLEEVTVLSSPTSATSLRGWSGPSLGKWCAISTSTSPRWRRPSAASAASSSSTSATRSRRSSAPPCARATTRTGPSAPPARCAGALPSSMPGGPGPASLPFATASASTRAPCSRATSGARSA